MTAEFTHPCFWITFSKEPHAFEVMQIHNLDNDVLLIFAVSRAVMNFEYVIMSEEGDESMLWMKEHRFIIVKMQVFLSAVISVPFKPFVFIHWVHDYHLSYLGAEAI